MPSQLPDYRSFAPRSRARYRVTLNPKQTDAAIARIVANLSQLASKRTGGLIRQANSEGLAWIQQQAAENLRRKIRAHGRPEEEGTEHRLEAAILNDTYSQADGRGIKFLIDAKIRKDVPYYASIEYGDESQIGRRLPFYFLGTSRGARSTNSASSAFGSYTHAQAPQITRSNAHAFSFYNNNQSRYYRSGHEANRYAGRGRVDNRAAARGLRTDRIIGPREAEHTAIPAGAERFTVTIRRPVPEYSYARDAGQQFLAQGIYEKLLREVVAKSGLETAGVKFVFSG
jgi:hypothetical protein